MDIEYAVTAVIKLPKEFIETFVELDECINNDCMPEISAQDLYNAIIWHDEIYELTGYNNLIIETINKEE